MVDNEIIKEWITKADQDFEFARINPVHWPTIFSKKEAEKAHRAAKNIRNFLKKKLQKSEP